MLNEEIKLILQQYCDVIHNGSKEKAAQALGVSTPTLWRWLEKNTFPKVETLIPVFEALDISLVTPTIKRTGEHSPSEKVAGNDLVSVPVYALAGAGAAWDLEESEPISIVNVPFDYINRADFALLISGDSMFPTIKNNSVVGIKKDMDFVQNEVYAIRIPYEGVAVKRIAINHTSKSYIVRSDNIDKNKYPEFELSMEEYNQIIIGRVVWVWQNV